MQNMMRLTDSIGSLNVFFDVNHSTKEIENISIYDGTEKIVLLPEHMEAAKDVIVKEYIASALEMAIVYKSGMEPLRC